MKIQILTIIWTFATCGALAAVNYRKGHLALHEVCPLRTRTISSGYSLPNQSWIFLHPDCPCSRASLEAFESLMSSTPTWGWHVVLVSQKSKEMLERTSLYRKATEHPNLQVHIDDGELASAFQVERSGHVVLIGVEGSIVYEGGVTPARGHLGDCRGMYLATQALLGNPSQSTMPPVFGCPLPGRSNSRGQAP